MKNLKLKIKTNTSSLQQDCTLPVRELTGLCVNPLISNPFFKNSNLLSFPKKNHLQCPLKLMKQILTKQI